MPNKDPVKQKELQRKHYQEHKNDYRVNLQRRREKNKKFLSRYKKLLSCSECGIKNPHVIDFHHFDDNKEMGVANAVFHRGIAKLKAEIRKCKVLCSNCHRILHAEKKYLGVG